MLEKIFSVVPDWIKSKLVVRMVYTGGSFCTARIVSFLTSNYVEHAFNGIMLAASKVGIPLVIKLDGPINEQVLQAAITGILMIACEYLIEHTHQNVVLPAIEATAKPPAAPPTGLIGLLVVLGCLGLSRPAQAWNPVSDIQTNLKWTLGEEASIGTAYKIGGGGETKVGKRGDSAMFGIFDYRFIKMSYGAISNPQDGSKIGDGLKTGLMLNYFLGWFKSPQTPAMQLFNNINIGPTVTIPLLSDAHPLKFPSVWLEANYRFGPRN